MVKRKVYTVNKCVVCHVPIEQVARGRPRLTCSDACQQTRYRSQHGKPSKKIKRIGIRIQKRRSVPFIERMYDNKFSEPVLTLSQKRWVYECMACGKPYLVERVTGGNNRVRPFCSDTCERVTDLRWKRFEDALAQASMSGGRIDPRVWERLELKKLSPLCPRCGVPFPPNTTLYGQRRGGRPRKYCSDRCCKEAYEQRRKNRLGCTRKHRMHPCAECGTMFDRTDSRGKRRMKYCSELCSRRFRRRVEYARKVARLSGKRNVNGQRAGYLNAPKNKNKRTFGNGIASEPSGKDLEKRGL
jgi:endogenous inhibitor of DNA gyrase (YacG/DUF329 family)